MPAWLAGLPDGASKTRTPSSPSCLTVCGGAIVMPKTGRMTRPNLSIWSTRPLTESTGIAKPTPDDAPRPEQTLNGVDKGSSVLVMLLTLHRNRACMYPLEFNTWHQTHRKHSKSMPKHRQCCWDAQSEAGPPGFAEVVTLAAVA